MPEDRAVVWQHGAIRDLGTLPGGHESNAFAVNDRGQVVGLASNAIPDPYSCAFFICWGTQTHAVLWQHGVMQDLGTLGGPDSIPYYINERGQVAGMSYTSAISSPVTGQPPQDPFLWQDGHMQDLGTLGGTFSGVGDLSAQGEIAGYGVLPDGDQHVYLMIPSDLAASKGITSNAPAPGTTGPAATTRARPIPCASVPTWRAGLAPAFARPCLGA